MHIKTIKLNNRFSAAIHSIDDSYYADVIEFVGSHSGSLRSTTKMHTSVESCISEARIISSDL